MKIISTLFLVSTASLFAQNDVSNSDLSRKLDLILGKLGGLEERVTKLETDNVEVKKELKEVAKSAKEAKTASHNLVIPQNEEDKKSFLNKLRIDLKSEEAKSRGAWTRKETWNDMRKNLTRFQVRKILGNPNMIKGNLSPRIDQVYHYLGDLDADGKEERATVDFYRDRVVSFEKPTVF
jgi:hypothetical protein